MSIKLLDSDRGKLMKKVVGLMLLTLMVFVAINLPELYGHESNETTQRLAEKFHDFMVSKNLEVYDIRDINMILRKIFHFAIYTFLTVATVIFFKRVSRRWWISFVCSPVLVVGVAAMDEKIQTMMPGRTGMVMDVFIDSAGIAFGIFIMLVVAVTEDRRPIVKKG